MKCNIISEVKENLDKLGRTEIKFIFSIAKNTRAYSRGRNT